MSTVRRRIRLGWRKSWRAPLAGWRLTREMALRMLADALMVNMALVVALAGRYVWLVAIENNVSSTEAVFLAFATAYLRTGWLLTAISIVTFYLSGFYTYGRAYCGRYKAMVIAQAVSLSYLIFGMILLLLRDPISLPRSVLLLGWAFTLILLFGARLWIRAWAFCAGVESRLWPYEPRDGYAQNILIIGGAGYVGSALVKRLLEAGRRVRVLDLLLYGDEPIGEFRGHPNFELMQADLRHIDSVVKAVHGMDAVVHLGAIVGDSACALCEELTLEINLQATRTIAEVAKGLGVPRFVFASTCSVYGASDEILDEKSSLLPLSLYARTKVASETVLLDLTQPAFAPTILRFGTIYGLSGRPRFDLVVNLLAAKAIQDGEAGIYGGNQWRPLVHVRDVGEAIALTLEAPLANVSGQIFNVGSNEQNYQIAELGRIIQDMVPAARVVMQPQEDNRNYRVRFDKIYRTLNFRPRYTVRDGVAEIVRAFATGAIRDYRDPRYSNYAYLHANDELQHSLLASARDHSMDVRTLIGEEAA